MTAAREEPTNGPVERDEYERIADLYDEFNQINDIELIYYVTHRDGRQERLVQAFRMRYLFRFEVEHLLARAGFVTEHLYSGFDKGSYGSTYPGELVFVTRKRKGSTTAG